MGPETVNGNTHPIANAVLTRARYRLERGQLPGRKLPSEAKEKRHNCTQDTGWNRVVNPERLDSRVENKENKVLDRYIPTALEFIT